MGRITLFISWNRSCLAIRGSISLLPLHLTLKIDVPYTETLAHKHTILQLMYPNNSGNPLLDLLLTNSNGSGKYSYQVILSLVHCYGVLLCCERRGLSSP